MQWLTALVAFVVLPRGRDAYNVLLLPRNDVDLLRQYRALTQAFIEGGHKVTVVADPDNVEIHAMFSSSRATLVYHRYAAAKTPKPHFDDLYDDERYEANYIEKYLKPELTDECMKVIYSDDLFVRIKSQRIHIAIVDSSVFCYHIIPYKLKVPFISLGSNVYPYLLRMHPLLAVEPCLMKDDTFLSRVYRIVGGIYGEIQPKLLIDESQFTHAVPDQKFYSLRDLAANSSLWFLVKESVLDCLLPVSPGVIQIGGLTSNINLPLPPTTRRKVDASKKNIVVIWFSHSLRNLTARIEDKFTAALRKSGMMYLWHKANNTMLDHVLHVDGASLDHVLNLPRVKLLISDCSTYTVAEAIRYAVPLLCMPILGEHRYTTYRVLTKNIGMHLDIRKFNAQDLPKRIRSILKNDTFRVNINRLSGMQKHLPNPAGQVVFWTEHIVKFGAENLKTSAREQSLYHFLMVDLNLAAFACSIMAAYLFKYSLKIFLNTKLAKKIKNKCPDVMKYFKKKKVEVRPLPEEVSSDEDEVINHRHTNHSHHCCHSNHHPVHGNRNDKKNE